MTNPESMGADTPTEEKISDGMIAQAEELINADPVLSQDEHCQNMIANGFTAPDGHQLNPLDFVTGRKATLAAESGAESSTPKETVVHSNPYERKLSDTDA